MLKKPSSFEELEDAEMEYDGGLSKLDMAMIAGFAILVSSAIIVGGCCVMNSARGNAGSSPINQTVETIEERMSVKMNDPEFNTLRKNWKECGFRIERIEWVGDSYEFRFVRNVRL